jgi:hypothetical protein
MLFPYCERPSFTPVHKWQNYGFVYLYNPGQQAGWLKTLNRMVASIPRI